MNSLEYIDHTLSTKRDWTRAQELHRKKLNEIVRTPSRRSNSPFFNLPCESITRKHGQNFHSGRTKHFQENPINYSKIHGVSPSANANSIKLSARARSSTPRLNSTLYSGFERKEKMRIENENKRLTRKIITVSPSFTVKQWKKDYKLVERLKKNICKPYSVTSNFTNFPLIKGKSLQVKKAFVSKNRLMLNI